MAFLANPTVQPLRCVWIGTANDGLGWLHNRFASFQSGARSTHIEHRPTTSLSELATLVEQGADRIVFASEHRLAYPARELQFLQHDCPDVPCAVACGNWWDGARRTGLGNINHVALAWYRWWDSWIVWLEGSSVELFGPCPQERQPLAWPRWIEPPRDLPQSSAGLTPQLSQCRGIIVGNCRQTRDAWADVARLCGYEVKAVGINQFLQQRSAVATAAQIEWVLWDDSCLDSARGVAAEAALGQFWEQLDAIRPDVLGIAAVSLPRFDVWETVGRMPRREIIVKPNTGQGLARVLRALLTPACSSAALART